MDFYDILTDRLRELKEELGKMRATVDEHETAITKLKTQMTFVYTFLMAGLLGLLKLLIDEIAK